MARRYNEFQFLLYQKFIFDKTHDVQKVAKAMGVATSTLYHYVEGETTFPVDLVAPLYNATEDPQFLNFIINDTDLMLAPRQRSESLKTILEEALDVAASSGKVIAETQSALAGDNDIDLKEKKRIIKAINKSQKELEELRKAL